MGVSTVETDPVKNGWSYWDVGSKYYDQYTGLCSEEENRSIS